MNKFFHFFFLLIISILSFGQAVKSESLIVGIPNAETVPKGEIQLAHESQLTRKKKWNGFTFLNAGIGKRTELGVSLVNLNSKKIDNFTLATGIKTTRDLFVDKETGLLVRGTVGTNIPISLQGKGVGNWTYGHVSVKLPKVKTRLTTGASFGTKQLFGRNAVSLIVGVEQPITKKLSFVADWYSGTHDLAAFIPAIQYNINKSDVIIAGLKIPNNARSGDLAIMIEVNKKIFDFFEHRRSKTYHRANRRPN